MCVFVLQRKKKKMEGVSAHNDLKEEVGVQQPG